MTTLPRPSPSLDKLASKTMRLGRELSQMAHAIYAGGNSRDFGSAARTLRRLAEREPFETRDDPSIEALQGIIDADLRSEIIGTERRFVETHFDAEGQHGEVCDCPVYSQRGQILLRVQELLRRFAIARHETLDRIAAERALIRLLRA